MLVAWVSVHAAVHIVEWDTVVMCALVGFYGILYMRLSWVAQLCLGRAERVDRSCVLPFVVGSLCPTVVYGSRHAKKTL